MRILRALTVKRFSIAHMIGFVIGLTIAARLWSN